MTRKAKRAMLISFMSLFLSFIGGVPVIFGYVTAIFNRTGSSMSEKDSSLLISFVLLSANIVVLNIVDRFNRRVLIQITKIILIVSIFNRIFSISDIVSLVIGYNYSRIFLIQHSLSILDIKSESNLDATIFLCFNYFFRFSRRHADSIYYHH